MTKIRFTLAACIFAAGSLTATFVRAADEEPAPSPWPPGRVIFEQSEAEKRIREALKQPTEVSYLDTQLSDVAADLELRHKINIELDSQKLAAEGKGGDLLITKSLKDATLGSALRLICDGEGLAYVIKNNVLLITTKSAASEPENHLIQIYQVHDLVVAPNDPTAANPDFQSLSDLITETVRKNDWQQNGGLIGFVKPFVGPGILALVITHTEEGHQVIENLLAGLRATKEPRLWSMQYKQEVKQRRRNWWERVEPTESPPAKDDVVAAVDANNALACGLLTKLCESTKINENLCLSPIGVSFSLLPLYEGAAGRTMEEFRRLLTTARGSADERWEKLGEWLTNRGDFNGRALRSRTRLLMRYDERVLASFTGAIERRYGAQIEPLDFRFSFNAVRSRIQDAVNRDTGGFLSTDGLLDDVNTATRLCTLNTVSFRSPWQVPFDLTQTRDEAFFAADGMTKVAIMRQSGQLHYGEFVYDPHVGPVQVIQKKYLPLSGGEATTSFVVMLPPDQPEALEKLQLSLAPERLDEWLAASTESQVEFHLPRFKVERQCDLKTPLESLGLKSAFTDEADFQNINGEQSLWLGWMKQAVKISVDEMETTAAAATAVGFFGGSLPTEKVVRCDRPFLFLVRDDATGTILFLGRVAKPVSESDAVSSIRGGGFF